MKLPKPESESSEYAPYLKASDIPSKGTTKVKLVGNVRESNSEYGNGVNVDVIIGKKKYSWTIKFTSGNYRRLHERFGDNPAKWTGTVSVVKAEYLNNKYVQVCD